MRNFITMALSLMVFTAPGAVFAQEFTDAQKSALKQEIEAFILNNPDVVIKSLEQHQQNQTAREEQQRQEKLKEYVGTFSSDDFPAIGNEEGDITVVELFDYNCGYCKRALPEIQKLVDTDKNVRVVFLELPILGPSSTDLAKWALAADKQDKYFEFHTALMKHTGKKSENTVKKIAENLGLDFDKLKQDKDSDAVQKLVGQNLKISRDLNINGTPGFIIEDVVIPGYVPYAQLESRIKQIRDSRG